MTILEFACLREGFSPAELGLPDSMLDGAGNQPLKGVRTKVKQMYRAAFEGPEKQKKEHAAYLARRAKAKGATA